MNKKKKPKKKVDYWNADARGAEGAYGLAELWLPAIEKAYGITPDEKEDIAAALRWFKKSRDRLVKKRIKKARHEGEMRRIDRARRKEKREIIAGCKRMGISHPWQKIKE